MKHIFYFLTILPIIWEIANLTNTKRVHDFAFNLRKMKGKKITEYTQKQKEIVFWMLGYIIWNFIGLFTFQWPVFLVFFLIGLIPKRVMWFRWIDSFISLIILLFIVLNAYHFKIDIWNLFF